MPNEFKIRNGFLSTGNSEITGSLRVTGGVTGSFSGNGAGLTGVAAFPFTGSALITGSLGVTGSASILAFTGSSATIFNIRNSANTLNFLEIRGDNQFLFTNNSNGVTLPFTIRSTDNNSAPYIRAISNGDISEASLIATRTGGSGVTPTAINRGFVQLSNGGGNLNVLSSNGGFAFSIQPVSAYNPTSDQMRLLNGNLSIGTGYTGTARLDVRAQGALSTDIAFRVRNSGDSSDLISFRGDGSQWIQSVPFIHAGTLTGGTNTAQSLYIGYNSTALASSGTRNTIIGTGTGTTSSGISQTAIGHSVSVGNYSTAIAIGVGATLTSNNSCVMGSESYPFTSMAIGTGGVVTSATNIQNMNLFVGGISGGYGLNTSAASKYFRLSAQNGSGTGEGAPIQFATAPSGVSGFSSNANVVFMEVRGDGAGLNHYQLSTPRIPFASIIDGYVQYSNDITAGNAAPHFRTENGTVVWLGDESRLFNVTASNITASNITAASLTIPSGSITLTTGSITMPNRPAFRVTGAGGGKVAVTTLSGSYLNVDYQQGGGWDNSTGTFTAPIAGLYQVNLVTRTNSNSLGTISQLIVYKNNTGGTTGTPQVMIEFGANTTMNHAGGSTISKLAVGDTLKMVVAVGEISFDANDNFSVAYIG